MRALLLYCCALKCVPEQVFGPQMLPFCDLSLELVMWTGVALSAMLIAYPLLSCMLPLALWALYLSLVNLGTSVTNYG